MLREELSQATDIDLSYSYQSSSENEESKTPTNIANVFEFCYELNENVVPPRYRLKNMDNIFPKYNEKDVTFSDEWSRLEAKLGSILRQLADRCFKKGLLTQIEHERYFVSGLIDEPLMDTFGYCN